jgi:EAL domain-containing protein (putative c-di-GMP-specific phosphodiesterase class I)
MALLLPGCSVSSLRRRAHQIVDDVRARQFVLSDGEAVRVSVSVGLAHAPTDAVDLPALYVKADQTLYEAKRSGRNRVGVVATSQLLSAGPEAVEAVSPAPRTSGHWNGKPADLDRLIEKAVDHDGVQVAYQPIIDLSTGQLVAVEALLRLTDDAGSPLPAGDVIPAAEASGLIADVGRRVIQVATHQSARWRAEHGVILPIAVNVSAAEVGLPPFSHDVLEALERSGVPPKALRIELTESMVLEAGSAGMDQLRELVEAGVELGIDDFGTGYASLSLLHALHASSIKIDQSFVAGIPDDPRAVAIVAGVISMAKSLDMTCIAEGIETESQRTYLAERGVFGQGYLLGRPDDAAAIGRLIAADRPAPNVPTAAPPP